jgi:hypothetical protein
LTGENTRLGHWRGNPTYGNTHGKLWFELDDDDDEYDPDSRQRLDALVKTGEEVDAMERTINRNYDDYRIIIDVESKSMGTIPTPFGPVEVFFVWLHIADKIWQVYKYEFNEWVFFRTGKRNEVIL